VERGVKEEAGIDPTLDVELGAEFEVFILFGGAEPGGGVGGFTDDDGAVIDIKGRFGPVDDVPSVQIAAVEERSERRLREEGRGG
jgi:hypothetical protein